MTASADTPPAPSPLLALRRQRKALLWAALGVLLLALLAAVFWPPRYTATGVILIEQQELPNDLVRSTVSSYASQRIQVISQRVMTTENLMGIIQRYNLYAERRKRRPREEVVKEMRSDTALQMISADVIDPRDGRPTKATIAFSIAYSSPSPELASKVANELVSLYLQQNIESREQSSRDAAVFLTGESARLDKEIKELQAKIADFKAQHADELPELTQLNLQKMQHAQINPTAQVYASTGERVQSPADRLKYVRTEYARALALYAPDHPDVRRLKREMEGLEAAAAKDVSANSESNDDRRQLEEAQAHGAAPAAVSTTASAAGATPSADEPAEKAVSSSADNPPYIQIQAQREA